MSQRTLGQWLKVQLERREWVQADLARKLGTSPGVVSHWVRGDRLPDPASCDLIADVLGVDRDLVLALAGHRTPDVELDPDDPRHELIALVRRIEWSPERVAATRSILRAYVEFDRKESKG